MKKILIADESFFVKENLIGILKRGGYKNIITASDGVEALEKYKTDKPDLIFLDIIMDKKNGLEVLEEIRNQDTKTYVIMISVIGRGEILSKALALGISKFIIKPFNEEEVLSVVKRVLG